MKLKEKVKKLLDEQRLDREIKIARKNIEDKEKDKVQVVKMSNSEENKNSEKTENSDKNKKFSFERVKDIGLVMVALMLIGFGYANFSSGEDVEEEIVQTSSQSSNSLGDVQLVSAEEGVLVENDDIVSNEVETSSEDTDETTSTTENTTESSSSDISAYFTELKLNRDNIYSQKLEVYQQIVDSTSISSEQKAIAIQEIENITETQNSIAIAEELIKLKGFENVVIYVNDNAVTVIVRSATLTSDQVAQIQNIVTRELDVSVSNISISNK